MQVTIKQKHVAEHRLPTKPAQDTYRWQIATHNDTLDQNKAIDIIIGREKN